MWWLECWVGDLKRWVSVTAYHTEAEAVRDRDRLNRTSGRRYRVTKGMQEEQGEPA